MHKIIYIRIIYKSGVMQLSHDSFIQSKHKGSCDCYDLPKETSADVAPFAAGGWLSSDAESASSGSSGCSVVLVPARW